MGPFLAAQCLLQLLVLLFCCCTMPRALLSRLCFAAVLIAVHVYLGRLLSDDPDGVNNPALSEAFSIGDARLASGAAPVVIPAGQPVPLATTAGFVPLLGGGNNDSAVVGLRLLDPSFFLRAVKVDFDLRTAGSAQSTCRGDVCEAQCDPSSMRVAVQMQSTVNQYAALLLPGNSLDKVLARYVAPVMPSLAVCTQSRPCWVSPEPVGNHSAFGVDLSLIHI